MFLLAAIVRCRVRVRLKVCQGRKTSVILGLLWTKVNPTRYTPAQRGTLHAVAALRLCMLRISCEQSSLP